jgi:hypothetical protein
VVAGYVDNSRAFAESHHFLLTASELLL